MTATTEVQMVPVDGITVLNPRARNRRVFHELITSIAHLGLKKPITVSRRGTEPEYDLVCGQGRLEAFIALGQSEIPAIVIEASQEDCYVMSLVENLARRHPGSLELMREIGALKDRGYRCFDRILLNGLIQPFQQPERVMGFFSNLSAPPSGEPGYPARGG